MTDPEIIENLKHNKYAVAINIKANSGSNEDAKDIFQDALVVLYQKVKQPAFALSVPLKTYLFAIVKNCWLQELRRRKKLPTSNVPDDVAETITDEEPGFSTATTAFNLLSEKCKELLILFYFKKKNFKEIAKVFSFSDERVAKNQKYRCITKAKEYFFTLSKTGTHG
jgi:RNA polymerase sigma factor (sigma-70 family)